MSTQFNYEYLWEYLPKRFTPTAEQQAHRKAIFQFKNGNCQSDIKQYFISKVKEKARDIESKSIVCFIPASTHAKTINRYESLSKSISDSTGLLTDVHTIWGIEDIESGHLGGKSARPIDNFSFNSSVIQGKNVILIDDVITRGTTFNQTAQKLIELGANKVTGLFVAKTINPNWQGNINAYYEDGFEQMDEFDPADYYDPELDGNNEPDPEDLWEQQMEDDYNPEY